MTVMTEMTVNTVMIKKWGDGGTPNKIQYRTLYTVHCTVLSTVHYTTVLYRRRMVDELPRLQQDNQPDSYTAQQMEVQLYSTLLVYRCRYSCTALYWCIYGGKAVQHCTGV